MEFRLDRSQIDTNRSCQLFIETFNENNVHFVLSDGHSEHHSLYEDFVYYLGKPVKIMEYDVLNHIIRRRLIFNSHDDNYVYQRCSVELREYRRKVDSSILTLSGFNPLCIRVPDGVATVVSAVSAVSEPQLATAELCK
jgi:hypothetical protein